MSINATYVFDHRPKVNYDYESKDFQDTPEFKAYVREIEALMRKKGTVTTRIIHEHLGYERQRWTLSALAFLPVRKDLILPVRYSLIER